MKKINSLVLLLLLAVTAMAQSLNLHMPNGSIIRYPFESIDYIDATETDVPDVNPNENYGWENHQDFIVTGGTRNTGPNNITLLGYVNAPATAYSEVGIAYRLKDSNDDMIYAKATAFDLGTDNRRYAVNAYALAPNHEYVYCAYMKDAGGQVKYAKKQMTFKTSDDGYYIFITGSLNDWTEPSIENADKMGAWCLYEYERGSYIYTGTFNVPAGDLQFRFYTYLGGWDCDGAIGSQADDAGVECSFDDNGSYKGSCVEGKGSWKFKDFEGGLVTFSVNLKNNTVSFWIYMLDIPTYYLCANSAKPMKIEEPETSENYMFYRTGKTTFSYTTFWPNDDNGKTRYNTKVWDRNDMLNNSSSKAWGYNGKVTAVRPLSGNLKQLGQWLGPEPEGWYTMTINMDDENNIHTYEFKAIEEPVTTYSSVSIIGTINGDNWTNFFDLTQCAKAPHNWSLLNFTLTEDTELKFCANHDWAKSWGGDGSKGIGWIRYTLPAGSENIRVSAGTYNFYLNDITGEWSILRVE